MTDVTAGRHRGGARSTRRHAARRTVQAVAATVSFVLFVGSGLAWYNYRTFDVGLKSIHVGGLGGPVPTASGGAHTPGRAQNILLVGDDSRAGLSKKEQHTLSVASADTTTSTDTIMLVHIPADGRRATLISIPRDSYVDIPGFGKFKINAAYVDGYDADPSASIEKRQENGATLLVNTVKKLTGVPVDHYVQLGFAGFEKVVKAIGRITVNLCHPVDDSVAFNRAQGVRGGSGFVARAGVQQLNAVRALQFVRQRHNLPGIGDDLGREKRQRYFLGAAFDAMVSADVLLNPVRLHHVVQALAGSFRKDDQFTLEAFAREMSRLSGSRISGQTIPTTIGPDVPGVGSVLTVDPAAVRRFVRDAFYGSSTPAPARPRSTAPTSARPAPTTTTTAGCID